MACYHPIPARRSQDGGPWRLHPQLGTADATVPCGKCLGCRTDRQNVWVTRCTHEAALWENNKFVTLTYDDEHLPPELRLDDLQKFLKRLRKAADKENQRHIITEGPSAIRYVACGEYGERTQRPHYHLILFNCAFSDEKPYDDKLSTSKTLELLWKQGAAKLAPFSSATAAYVAGYLTKTGKRDYYNELGQKLTPPFFRMSLRPAIGQKWVDKYSTDIQNGYTIIDGIRKKLPRYYAQRLIRKREQAGLQLQEVMTGTPRKHTDKYDPERLAAAEQIHRQSHNQKHRQAL